MEKLSLDELFPQTAGLSINSDEPTPHLTAPEPTPEPIQERDDSPLRQELDGVKQLLSAVVANQTARQAPQPQYQQDPSQVQRAYDESLSYKPKDFMTDDDAVALLNNPKPREKLNQIFNKVAEEVHTPFAQELRKRDAVLAQMIQKDQASQQQTYQQSVMRQNVQNFYTAHPDMQNFQELVPVAAQQIAEEAQRSPHLYMGKTDADIHDMLAERVKSTVRRHSEGLSAEESPAPTVSYPRTMMEHGAGNRSGQPRREGDASKQALKEMAQWHKNGKRM